jgi:prepilin signal peptidase PulO-like enzyme (type II secretory pathway)
VALNPAVDPSLHLGSSNHELPFLALFFWGSNQLTFPPQWYHVDLAVICHFLILDLHRKIVGPIYGSHLIGLLYFIGPWTLIESNPEWKACKNSMGTVEKLANKEQSQNYKL